MDAGQLFAGDAATVRAAGLHLGMMFMTYLLVKSRTAPCRVPFHIGWIRVLSGCCAAHIEQAAVLLSKGHVLTFVEMLLFPGSHAALELDRIGTASPAVGSSTAAQSASSVPAQPASTAPALVQGSNRLQPAQLQQQATVSADQMDEMQHCLALIASQPAVAASSMEVLSKILSNLAAAYQVRAEPKCGSSGA